MRPRNSWHADRAYWSGLGVLVGIQVAFVVAVLLAVYLSNGRRSRL